MTRGVHTHGTGVGDLGSGQLWAAGVFARAATAAAQVLDSYVQRGQQGIGPVLCRLPPQEISDRLNLRKWIRDGGMTTGTLVEFLTAYLEQGTVLHHPGYMSHQCAVPDIGAAVGDLVHGVCNNAMSLYEMGAAGATVELAVVDWMLTKIGWRSGTAAGVLNHGGSLANLVAMLAARASAFPSVWEQGTTPGAVILAPPGAHVSIVRAAAVLGLGSRAVRALPTDDLGRVDAAAAAAAIDAQHRAGRLVMAVVANACAAPTGLFDPIADLAEICGKRKVWLHVDAAHGGSALLVPSLRHLLIGIDRADSVVWDAHKMLRTSTLAAAVLLRRESDLHSALRESADYLFFDGDRPGPDLMHYTIEGAKAELGLKVFLNLAWRGERGLADYVLGRH